MDNFCVTDAYEPGSVVKPIVMASALEKGAIQEQIHLYAMDRRLLEIL